MTFLLPPGIKGLILQCMSQNGQTHFKNLAVFTVSDHFGTLCIEGLMLLISKNVFIIQVMVFP